MASKAILLLVLLVFYYFPTLSLANSENYTDASCDNEVFGTVICPSWLQGSWAGTKLNSITGDDESSGGWDLAIENETIALYSHAFDMTFNGISYCGETNEEGIYHFDFVYNSGMIDGYVTRSIIRRIGDYGKFEWLYTTSYNSCSRGDPDGGFDPAIESYLTLVRFECSTPLLDQPFPGTHFLGGTWTGVTLIGNQTPSEYPFIYYSLEDESEGVNGEIEYFYSTEVSSDGIYMVDAVDKATGKISRGILKADNYPTSYLTLYGQEGWCTRPTSMDILNRFESRFSFGRELEVSWIKTQNSCNATLHDKECNSSLFGIWYGFIQNNDNWGQVEDNVNYTFKGTNFTTFSSEGNYSGEIFCSEKATDDDYFEADFVLEDGSRLRALISEGVESLEIVYRTDGLCARPDSMYDLPFKYPIPEPTIKRVVSTCALTLLSGNCPVWLQGEWYGKHSDNSKSVYITSFRNGSIIYRDYEGISGSGTFTCNNLEDSLIEVDFKFLTPSSLFGYIQRMILYRYNDSTISVVYAPIGSCSRPSSPHTPSVALDHQLISLSCNTSILIDACPLWFYGSWNSNSWNMTVSNASAEIFEYNGETNSMFQYNATISCMMMSSLYAEGPKYAIDIVPVEEPYKIRRGIIMWNEADGTVNITMGNAGDCFRPDDIHDHSREPFFANKLECGTAPLLSECPAWISGAWNASTETRVSNSYPTKIDNYPHTYIGYGTRFDIPVDMGVVNFSSLDGQKTRAHIRCNDAHLTDDVFLDVSYIDDEIEKLNWRERAVVTMTDSGNKLSIASSPPNWCQRPQSAQTDSIMPPFKYAEYTCSSSFLISSNNGNNCPGWLLGHWKGITINTSSGEIIRDMAFQYSSPLEAEEYGNDYWQLSFVQIDQDNWIVQTDGFGIMSLFVDPFGSIISAPDFNDVYEASLRCEEESENIFLLEMLFSTPDELSGRVLRGKIGRDLNNGADFQIRLVTGAVSKCSFPDNDLFFSNMTGIPAHNSFSILDGASLEAPLPPYNVTLSSIDYSWEINETIMGTAMQVSFQSPKPVSHNFRLLLGFVVEWAYVHDGGFETGFINSLPFTLEHVVSAWAMCSNQSNEPVCHRAAYNSSLVSLFGGFTDNGRLFQKKEVLKQTYSNQTLKLVISDLEFGKEIVVRIFSQGSFNKSESSEITSETVQGAPKSPENVSIYKTSVSDMGSLTEASTSLTIEFNTPSASVANGAEITDFLFEFDWSHAFGNGTEYYFNYNNFSLNTSTTGVTTCTAQNIGGDCCDSDNDCVDENSICDSFRRVCVSSCSINAYRGRDGASYCNNPSLGAVQQEQCGNDCSLMTGTGCPFIEERAHATSPCRKESYCTSTFHQDDTSTALKYCHDEIRAFCTSIDPLNVGCTRSDIRNILNLTSYKTLLVPVVSMESTRGGMGLKITVNELPPRTWIYARVSSINSNGMSLATHSAPLSLQPLLVPFSPVNVSLGFIQETVLPFDMYYYNISIPVVLEWNFTETLNRKVAATSLYVSFQADNRDYGLATGFRVEWSKYFDFSQSSSTLFYLDAFNMYENPEQVYDVAIRDLEIGEVYFVRVYTLIETFGIPSTETVSLSPRSASPDPPVNVSAFSYNDTAVIVFFSPPYFDGGRPISSYEVFWNVAEQNQSLEDKSTFLNTTWVGSGKHSPTVDLQQTIIVDKLDMGVVYNIIVAACNSEGCSFEETEQYNGQSLMSKPVRAKPKREPGQPTSLNSRSHNTTSIELALDLPIDDGGDEVFKYIIEWINLQETNDFVSGFDGTATIIRKQNVSFDRMYDPNIDRFYGRALRTDYVGTLQHRNMQDNANGDEYSLGMSCPFDTSHGKSPCKVDSSCLYTNELHDIDHVWAWDVPYEEQSNATEKQTWLERRNYYGSGRNAACVNEINVYCKIISPGDVGCDDLRIGSYVTGRGDFGCHDDTNVCIFSQTRNSIIVSGLTTGAPYQFRASACNTAGCGEFSLFRAIDQNSNDSAIETIVRPRHEIRIFRTSTDIDNWQWCANWTLFEKDDHFCLIEGRRWDNYSIVLNAEPTSDVIIDIYVETDSKVLKLLGLPRQFTFTKQNWKIPQEVSLFHTDDTKDDGFDQTAWIIHSVTSDNSDYTDESFVPTNKIPLIVHGDDFSAVLLYQENVTSLDSSYRSHLPINAIYVQEGKTTVDPMQHGNSILQDNLAIRLGTQPLGNVLIILKSTLNESFTTCTESESLMNFDEMRPEGSGRAVASSKDHRCFGVRHRLLFDSSNWNIPQLVPLGAIDDHLEEGNHSDEWILETVSESDQYYDKLISASVHVSITDNDVSNVYISTNQTETSSLFVNEGGSAQYYVLMTSQPHYPVSVSIQPQVSMFPGHNQLGLFENNPLFESLAFTIDPMDWDKPAATIVAYYADDFIDMKSSYISLIDHVISSDDDKYNQIETLNSIKVNISDNDEAGLLFTKLTGFIGEEPFEGENERLEDSIGISLRTKPLSSVDLSILNDNQLNVEPKILRWTPDTWNQVQYIHLSAVSDGVVEKQVHFGYLDFKLNSLDPQYNDTLNPSVFKVKRIAMRIVDVANADTTPPPILLFAKEIDTSHSIRVKFDRPVFPANLTFGEEMLCEYVSFFSKDTLEKFGKNSNCTWGVQQHILDVEMSDEIIVHLGEGYILQAGDFIELEIDRIRSTSTSVLSTNGYVVLQPRTPAPVLRTARFSSSGDSIIIGFNGVTTEEIEEGKREGNCSEVLWDQLSYFGENPICRWLNINSLQISLGKGAKIVPKFPEFGFKWEWECPPTRPCPEVCSPESSINLAEPPHRFGIRPVPNSIYHASGCITVLPPEERYLAPLISAIEGPEIVSPCVQSFTLDGSSSVGGYGRPLVYTWRIEPRLQNYNQLKYLNSSGVVQVPAEDMQQGKEYVFYLTVEGFMHAYPAESSLKIVKPSSPVPRVQFITPRILTVDASQLIGREHIRLLASVTPPECPGNYSAPDIFWFMDGVLLSGEKKRHLLISTDAFVLNKQHYISVAASVEHLPSFGQLNGSATTAVEITSTGVIAKIVPSGNVWLPYYQDRPVTLDATYKSYDIANRVSPHFGDGNLSFHWFCFNDDEQCERVLSSQDTNAGKIYVYPNMLSIGTGIELFVNVSNTLGQSSLDSVKLYVDPDYLDNGTKSYYEPRMHILVGQDNAIDRQNTRVDPNKKITFSISSDEIVSGTSSCDIKWSQVDHFSPPRSDRLEQEAFWTSLDRVDMVLAPFVLKPKGSYTFRVVKNCAENSSIISIWNEITVEVNTPPYAGTVEVEPSKGIALSTDFSVRALDWMDDSGDLPLRYRFYASVAPEASGCNMSTNLYELQCGESLNHRITRKLPQQTKFIQVEIIDAWGMAAYACYPVSVENSIVETSEADEEHALKTIEVLYYEEGIDAAIPYLWDTVMHFNSFPSTDGYRQIIRSQLLEFVINRYRENSDFPISLFLNLITSKPEELNQQIANQTIDTMKNLLSGVSKKAVQLTPLSNVVSWIQLNKISNSTLRFLLSKEISQDDLELLLSDIAVCVFLISRLLLSGISPGEKTVYLESQRLSLWTFRESFAQLHEAVVAPSLPSVVFWKSDFLTTENTTLNIYSDQHILDFSLIHWNGFSPFLAMEDKYTAINDSFTLDAKTENGNEVDTFGDQISSFRFAMYTKESIRFKNKPLENLKCLLWNQEEKNWDARSTVLEIDTESIGCNSTKFGTSRLVWSSHVDTSRTIPLTVKTNFDLLFIFNPESSGTLVIVMVILTLGILSWFIILWKEKFEISDIVDRKLWKVPETVKKNRRADWQDTRSLYDRVRSSHLVNSFIEELCFYHSWYAAIQPVGGNSDIKRRHLRVLLILTNLVTILGWCSFFYGFGPKSTLPYEPEYREGGPDLTFTIWGKIVLALKASFLALPVNILTPFLVRNFGRYTSSLVKEKKNHKLFLKKLLFDVPEKPKSRKKDLNNGTVIPINSPVDQSDDEILNRAKMLLFLDSEPGVVDNLSITSMVTSELRKQYNSYLQNVLEREGIPMSIKSFELVCRLQSRWKHRKIKMNFQEQKTSIYDQIKKKEMKMLTALTTSEAEIDLVKNLEHMKRPLTLDNFVIAQVVAVLADNVQAEYYQVFKQKRSPIDHSKVWFKIATFAKETEIPLEIRSKPDTFRVVPFVSGFEMSIKTLSTKSPVNIHCSHVDYICWDYFKDGKTKKKNHKDMFSSFWPTSSHSTSPGITALPVPLPKTGNLIIGVLKEALSPSEGFFCWHVLNQYSNEDPVLGTSDGGTIEILSSRVPPLTQNYYMSHKDADLKRIGLKEAERNGILKEISRESLRVFPTRLHKMLKCSFVFILVVALLAINLGSELFLSSLSSRLLGLECLTVLFLFLFMGATENIQITGTRIYVRCRGIRDFRASQGILVFSFSAVLVLLIMQVFLATSTSNKRWFLEDKWNDIYTQSQPSEVSQVMSLEKDESCCGYNSFNGSIPDRQIGFCTLDAADGCAPAILDRVQESMKFTLFFMSLIYLILLLCCLPMLALFAIKIDTGITHLRKEPSETEKAALIIQGLLRGKRQRQIANKRRQLVAFFQSSGESEKAREERRNAAVKIQSRYRGMKGRERAFRRAEFLAWKEQQNPGLIALCYATFILILIIGIFTSIVFGSKFNQEQFKDWLHSSSIAVVLDIFMSQNLMIALITCVQIQIRDYKAS